MYLFIYLFTYPYRTDLGQPSLLPDVYIYVYFVTIYPFSSFYSMSEKLSNRNFPIIFYLISPDWLLNKNAEAERVQHILSKQIFERKNNWQTKYFG